MLALLGSLKPKLLALGAAVLGAVYFIIRIGWLKKKVEVVEYERDKAVFQIEQGKAIADNLAEVDQTFSRRASLRAQERQESPDKVPDRLRDNDAF